MINYASYETRYLTVFLPPPKLKFKCIMQGWTHINSFSFGCMIPPCPFQLVTLSPIKIVHMDFWKIRIIFARRISLSNAFSYFINEIHLHWIHLTQKTSASMTAFPSPPPTTCHPFPWNLMQSSNFILLLQSTVDKFLNNKHE